jgi:hypothetical protein
VQTANSLCEEARASNLQHALVIKPILISIFISSCIIPNTGKSSPFRFRGMMQLLEVGFESLRLLHGVCDVRII